MDNKKFWLASAAATSILAAGSVLWYVGLFRKFYRSQYGRGALRSRPIYPLNAMSRAAWGLLLAGAYPHAAAHSNRSPVAEGARLGAWAGALEAVPQILVRAGNIRVGLPATLSAIGFEVAIGTAAGAAVGAIYGKDITGLPEPLPVEDEETASRPIRMRRHDHRTAEEVAFEREPITADKLDPMQPPTGAPPEAEVAG